jgi:hypothetical protein
LHLLVRLLFLLGHSTYLKRSKPSTDELVLILVLIELVVREIEDALAREERN